MREAENIAAVARLEPDYLGFIFYEKSPRFAGELAPSALKSLPRTIRRVGVFVDAPEESIREIAEAYGLDLLQLHGDETPEMCARLREIRPVIKAFGIENEEDVKKSEHYAGTCDYFLFDTRTPARGGSGRPFDHRLLVHYTGPVPYLLSGGLGPADAARLAAIDDPRCVAVDVNSRFESVPGVKDPALVQPFIETIKNQRYEPH